MKDLDFILSMFDTPQEAIEEGLEMALLIAMKTGVNPPEFIEIISKVFTKYGIRTMAIKHQDSTSN